MSETLDSTAVEERDDAAQLALDGAGEDLQDKPGPSEPPIPPVATTLARRPAAGASAALVAGATASERIAAATEIATQLDHVIKAQGLRTKIGRRKVTKPDGSEEWADRFHIDVEAWQTLAAFLELAVIPVWTRPVCDPATGHPVFTPYTVRKEFFPKGTKAADIRNGQAQPERVETAQVEGFSWEARVEVFKDGCLVSAGEAMCSRSEESWRDDTDHDLRSMAVTRAVRNAIANTAKWIVALAGYGDAPASDPAGAGEASDELRSVARQALGYLLDGDVTAADQLVERLLAEFDDRFPVVAGQTIVLAATAIKQHRETRAQEAASA